MQSQTLTVLFLAGNVAAAAALMAAPGANVTPAPPATNVPPAAAPTTANTTTSEPRPLLVAGSDLLQVAIGEPLRNHFKQIAKVDFIGTLPALSALKDGRSQVAIVAAPPGRPIAPEGFKTIPLCFQADYVLVNENNPVTALDARQITGIFSGNPKDITRWGDVSLSGEWTTRPVAPFVTSTDDGIVVELFKNLSLGRQSLKPIVQVKRTSQELLKEIADNPNAIAVSGYDPGPPAKVLLFIPERPATGTARDPVRPTADTVNSGAYPLRLPFYIVYNPSEKARVREILAVLLSDEYATRLREQHFIPVPETLRNRSLLELDKAD